jgi:hypothetical protein
VVYEVAFRKRTVFAPPEFQAASAGPEVNVTVSMLVATAQEHGADEEKVPVETPLMKNSKPAVALQLTLSIVKLRAATLRLVPGLICHSWQTSLPGLRSETHTRAVAGAL